MPSHRTIKPAERFPGRVDLASASNRGDGAEQRALSKSALERLRERECQLAVRVRVHQGDRAHDRPDQACARDRDTIAAASSPKRQQRVSEDRQIFFRTPPVQKRVETDLTGTPDGMSVAVGGEDVQRSRSLSYLTDLECDPMFVGVQSELRRRAKLCAAANQNSPWRCPIRILKGKHTAMHQ